MPEKFYQMEPCCTLHEDYNAYKVNEDAVRAAFSALAVKHGIESKEYYPGPTKLAIIPTDNDRISLSAKLQKKVLEQGLVFFRANSDVGKDWAAMVADTPPQRKPCPTRYVREFIPRARTRLFVIDDVTYCSIDTEATYTVPDDFVEMKASEFFKVIEDFNARIEAS